MQLIVTEDVNISSSSYLQQACLLLVTTAVIVVAVTVVDFYAVYRLPTYIKRCLLTLHLTWRILLSLSALMDLQTSSTQCLIDLA
jgi:hypothetical protein